MNERMQILWDWMWIETCHFGFGDYEGLIEVI